LDDYLEEDNLVRVVDVIVDELALLPASRLKSPILCCFYTETPN
jgi:hypothetical protein